MQFQFCISAFGKRLPFYKNILLFIFMENKQNYSQVRELQCRHRFRQTSSREMDTEYDRRLLYCQLPDVRPNEDNRRPKHTLFLTFL